MLHNFRETSYCHLQPILDFRNLGELDLAQIYFDEGLWWYWLLVKSQINLAYRWGFIKEVLVALWKLTILLWTWGIVQKEVCNNFESYLRGPTPSHEYLKHTHLLNFHKKGPQPYWAWKLLCFAVKLPNVLQV